MLPLLSGHRRGGDVVGRLVELDPGNCTVAREQAPPGLEVSCADAERTDASVGAVPADVLLLCGIFGNVSDDDVERTVRAVPSLCATESTVVWTRHRHAPDLTTTIRGWLAEEGVQETAFVTEDGPGWAVGAGVFRAEPRPLEAGRRLFAFSTRPQH